MTLLGRREFLIGGAGAVLLGARAVRAATEDPELTLPHRRAAYEPWRSWRADGPQSPLTVVHAAVLAANPTIRNRGDFRSVQTASMSTPTRIGTWARWTHIGAKCT